MVCVNKANLDLKALDCSLVWGTSALSLEHLKNLLNKAFQSRRRKNSLSSVDKMEQ